ncbi:MAG: lamin tail domain-containing protein, partial [Pirellulaceae bacterium]|nr:lamin tail domain-containing protein [Pirellulaceae bacterium]
MLYTRSRKPGAMGSRPRRTRLQFEPLEPRSLLAADPIISEIMAVNDRTLADGDGDFPDWLELFNRGDMTVDLGGHYLTDSAGNLTKWQFPQADLGPGDFLLVFASGKQGQEIPAGEIHASFKLNSGGEYLALVDTDGTTVLSEFTPSFPPQEADTSHGESMTAGITALVSEGDSAKVLIPSQVD